MIVSRALFPVSSGFSAISQLHARLDKLQTQLSTGKRFDSLSSLGNDRIYDLTVRARIGRIDAFKANVDTINLRLDFFDNAITRLDEIEADSRAAVASGGIGADGLNKVTAQELAHARLDEVLTLLGSEINGRYLFGGDKTDANPVVNVNTLLNGDATRDGLTTLIAQRKQADAGAGGLGRLTTTVNTDTAYLTEDGIHPFGFKLASVSTTGANITVNQPAGAPQELSVQIGGATSDGDQISVTLNLPDGKQHTLTLTAVTGTPIGANEFQIGGSANATALNFQAALNTQLTTATNSVLAAQSVYAAAESMIPSHGNSATRVDGPPYDSATAMIAADPADTVIWYTGSESATSPRQTVRGRVDETTFVNYGVQANEEGLAALVSSLAAMAVETYPSSDPDANARYNAMAQGQLTRLSESNNSKPGSIEVIALELGVARSTVGNASERHKAYANQLETLLAEIEQAPLEEVAAELLMLQTRLQASYQTTANISQLTLVNYL